MRHGGSMHKKIPISISPGLLDKSYRLRSDTDVYFCGPESRAWRVYVESAASGMVCWHNAPAYQAFGKEAPVPSAKTALGALAAHVSGSVSANFPADEYCVFGQLSKSRQKPEKRQEKREGKQGRKPRRLRKIRLFTGELSQSCLESEK